MALEAFMFSEDPLISSYTTCYSKEYNYLNNNNNSGIFSMDYYYDLGNYSSIYTNDCGIFDVINSDNTTISNQEILVDDVNQWAHDTQAQQQCNNNNNNNYSLFCEYSSPEEAPPPSVVANTVAEGGARRKRRRRSSKNKEEVEQQRMTHIAVERNRRRQMNDYLASIRSLMPSSYVQRGDQASIVAGAINYVKELEQLLQSMEAQKKSTKPHYHLQEESQSTLSPPDEKQCGNTVDNNVATNSSPNQPPALTPTPTPAPAPTLPPPVFAEFFSFPQYSTSSTGLVSQQQSVGSNSVSSNSGVGEIEVTMVESHANVKILAKKQPKQLLKLIAGFQGLRLNVLHLNVTTSLDSFVLYSLSLKVEEGCQLNSVDDIAAAANHILAQIQEEAVVIL